MLGGRGNRSKSWEYHGSRRYEVLAFYRPLNSPPPSKDLILVGQRRSRAFWKALNQANPTRNGGDMGCQKQKSSVCPKKVITTIPYLTASGPYYRRQLSAEKIALSPPAAPPLPPAPPKNAHSRMHQRNPARCAYFFSCRACGQSAPPRARYPQPPLFLMAASAVDRRLRVRPLPSDRSSDVATALAASSAAPSLSTSACCRDA